MIRAEEFNGERKYLVDNDRTIQLLYGGTADTVKNSYDRISSNAFSDIDIHSFEHNAPKSQRVEDFKPSSRRFVVALLICLSSALNCFIQYTFISLWKVAIEAYDVDALAINMLALVFAVFFIPGSILAIALYARYGLNSCIIGAAFLNLLACLFRCSSCMTNVPHIAYTAVLVGHIMAAIGSPLVLNAPSRVANDWFPKSERALAVSIMTQANYIGGGLGGLLPALQVSSVADIFPMLLSQAAVAGVILLLSIIFTPRHSPVHPDFDALYQVELRSHVDVSTAASIYKQMFSDFSVMLGNIDFLRLLISFSLQAGLSWALSAVLGQLLQPCGYSGTLVGQVLLLTTFAGSLGSFSLAYFLRDNHQNYFFIYKVLVILTAVGCFLVFGFNQPGNSTLILLCWTLYGFASGPLSPVVLELAAEMTYPIPADNSTTLLYTVAIVVYFSIAMVLTPLLNTTRSATCADIITPTSTVSSALALLSFFIAVPIKIIFNRKDLAAKEFELRQTPPSR